MLHRFICFMRRRLERRTVIVIAGALAFILTLPSLFIGFNADDHFLRMVVQGFPGMPELAKLPGLVSVPMNMFAYADGRPEYNRAYIDRGLLPWWSYDHVRFRRFHPLVGVTLWLDYLCFGDHAMPAHLQSLFWYAAVAMAMALFYRRFITPAWCAGVAAILYAIDDAHGFSVGWISNRNAFMPVLPAAFMLIVHDRWRRDAWKPGLVAGPVLLLLTLMVCESGVGVCAYLMAYALFVDTASWRARFESLVPYGAIALGWLAFYRHYGYGVVSSGIYVDMGNELGLFLRTLPERLPQLLLAQLANPNPALVFNHPLLSIALAAYAVIVLGLITWILWPLLKKDPISRFCVFGMIVSAIPMCGTLPDTRLLFFPGIGGMGLVAMFFREYATRMNELGATQKRRVAAHILCALWIWMHLIQAPALLPFNSMNIARYFRVSLHGANTAPMDPKVAQDDVVIVNTPSDVIESFLPVVRSSLRQPVPAHCWALNAGMRAVNVTRTDSHTLLVKPEGGFAPAPWGALFRSPRDRIQVGYHVQLTGLTIDVLSVTDDGRAEIAQFYFDKNLDDPSLRWIAWSGKGYVPWTVPAVGATGRVGPVDKDYAG